MTAFISGRNRTAVQTLLQGGITNTAVSVSFRADEYDQQVRRYYTALAPTQPPLTGQIQKAGASSLQLGIAGIATLVGSTQLFQLNFAMVPPASKSQTLREAIPAANSVVKAWGFVV
jgi:hypothetical protein